MIPKNTLLHTKDGRQQGNAIVRRWYNISQLYSIKTDYGNLTRMSEAEIHETFYIGPIAKPDHKHFVE